MEIRSTGNPDTNNPGTRRMIQYLAKKGREAKMSGICKYPESICLHMTVLKGKAYCDATPCQLTGELPERTKADKIRSGSDIYISVQIAGCIVAYLCQSELLRGTAKDHKELISTLTDDLMLWLQQPAED